MNAASCPADTCNPQRIIEHELRGTKNVRRRLVEWPVMIVSI